ncbi:carbonic anhydrase [Kangiella sp. TOML190]|uniref:carbonic anhydrase n=1 Tax=Kangiella sp. TOML190 TaxID=2931351 RepID=UPI00203CB01B|nr:carbonic anhydrase [Kangiella sp. TOML190]
MISAEQALSELKKGNQRYVECYQNSNVQLNSEQRSQLASGQAPFAIILGCSDSRVPAEIVFDQGLGDLFVIRVAGNIVAPSQIASVEFAVESFGTPLVVVMGHSNCGAINATVDYLLDSDANVASGNLESIVTRISPAVLGLIKQNINIKADQLKQVAVKANVEKSVQKLVGNSDILTKALAEKRLTIVGAEYSLESGQVEFFDD